MNAKKDVTYKDDKQHYKSKMPLQIRFLCSPRIQELFSETYLFFQPHIHQIVLDGQDSDWVPRSDGQYCIEQGTVVALEGKKLNQVFKEQYKKNRSK